MFINPAEKNAAKIKKCEICSKTYTRADYFKKHVENCKNKPQVDNVQIIPPPLNQPEIKREEDTKNNIVAMGDFLDNKLEDTVDEVTNEAGLKINSKTIKISDGVSVDKVIIMLMNACIQRDMVIARLTEDNNQLKQIIMRSEKLLDNLNLGK